MPVYRQEVLNVLLAQLLQDRGVVALPELIMDTHSAHRAMPDVLVSYRGLRLAIEGEVGDQTRARDRAWGKARQRVEQNIAHVAIAVVYPPDLRRMTEISHLKAALAQTTLAFSICNYLTADRPDWQDGDVQHLVAALETNLQQLLPEDAVRQAARTLREGIEALARVILDVPANVQRIAEPLGIEARSADSDSVARIAALVLANALLFQEELARHNPDIPTLRQCMAARDIHGELSRLWKHIYEDINYQAIFRIGHEILLRLSPDARLDRAFQICADRVAEVARSRVALQHDLVGRLYHLLLGEIAKPLGTYYTSVSAATMLLRLALNPARWPSVRWKQPSAVAGLRIADLACGTGTLLMAAVEAIKDNFLRATAGRGSQQALRRLLKETLTDALWGLDVLPSAVHLTAATLMLPVPEVVIPNMHIYAAPFGVRGRAVYLGSLDFLRQRRRSGFVPLTPEVTGQTVTDTRPMTVEIDLPQMDLICMNPPFTRSVGGNLLFGSLPPTQRKRCQRELQGILREAGASASATAGLGSVFLALADRYLKPGGRLAFVLPKALLSGVEWKASRRLLADGYVVETLVVSHDPERWNFSENTDLSECLIVACKQQPSQESAVTVVNLWRNPDAPLTALAIADKLREFPIQPLGAGDPTVWVVGKKMAEAFTIPWATFRSLPHWLLPCAFAQWQLICILFNLVTKNQLILPNLKPVTLKLIPLIPLQELGELGPDIRDVFDGFYVVQQSTNYPAFWDHDADRVQSMAQSPNAYLLPLGRSRPGRPLRNAQVLWNRAGSLLIAERLRLNTQRLTAVLLEENVLSNVWWPVALKSGLDGAAAKALVLWLNSTLGLLILIGHRLETQGAWVKFKKPTLRELPVLDVRSLNPTQLSDLAAAYDRLAHEALQPFPQLAEDPIRRAIDEALAQVLGLPDLTWLRKCLAAEPILSLRPLRQELAPAFRLDGANCLMEQIDP
ncbi:hypothetical protein HRbin08_02245 [bacterium HR08]|nr:hypothetical protein HRbin08_02245 [bacterium HR08]